jgi:hypothetical protein
MKGTKDIEFYKKVINRNNEFIKENEKKINFSKINDENISSSILAYFTWHLNNLIANYSKGSNKEELRKQFSECIVVMEKVWNKKITKVFYGKKQEELDQYRLEPYLNMLQMISLGVLLDVPDDEFKTLVNLIDRDNIKDYLLEFLISYRIERKQINSESYSRYLLIPKLFSPLVEITKTLDKIEAEAKIKKYLEKDWIKIPKNHFLNFKLSDIKEYDVNSGFVGLWAFEVAAIVKIKKLSDEAFINNMFYPDKLR